MPTKEYTIFFDDLSKQSVKAANIISALESIKEVEKVIRVSLQDKEKVSVSSEVVDDDFEFQDEFRPPANM